MLLDLVAACALLIIAWRELRNQASDIGRVAGVLALAAIVFVLILVGRAFLGI